MISFLCAEAQIGTSIKHIHAHFCDIVSNQPSTPALFRCSDAIMATIKPSFLYGVRSGVRGGIHFSGEQSILYPAGSGVARYEQLYVQYETLSRGSSGNKSV